MIENEKNNELSLNVKDVRQTNISVLLAVTAIFLIVVGFGLGYLEITRINTVMNGTKTSIKMQADENKADISDLQKALQNVNSLTEKSASLSEKQGQMIADWEAAQKGNLDKWYVAEAEYLVRLANDHLVYTKNTAMALSLLQSADQVLAKINDTSLLPLRQSITNDITRLQATPAVDVTQMYLNLSALDSAIDRLPLPAEPMQAKETTKSAAVQISPELSWWRKGLLRTQEALKKIVVVSYNGSDALPLILPKERQYLYQNLHAQLQNAIWGALHGNWRVYQLSLANATEWVRHYFVLNSSETQAMLNQLQTLVALNVQPSNADMTATLQLFNNYLMQNAPRVVAK
jgi:uroporphyrin-3 C-methyltransferase